MKEACEKLTAAGAKRALMLNVGEPFIPLNGTCRTRLAEAINKQFQYPGLPGLSECKCIASTDSGQIKINLVAQLTSPVRWTQSVENRLKMAQHYSLK